MKHPTPLFALLLAFLPTTLLAEATPEEAVRQKEAEMSAALIANDVEALKALFAEDLIVNNPANTVLTDRKGVMDRVHAGIIRYDRFDQHIELVRAYGDDTVIVMGEERVRPIGDAPGAGTVLRRRYTDVWMRTNGEWRLQARHANVIPPKPSDPEKTP